MSLVIYIVNVKTKYMTLTVQVKAIAKAAVQVFILRSLVNFSLMVEVRSLHSGLLLFIQTLRIPRKNDL